MFSPSWRILKVHFPLVVKIYPYNGIEKWAYIELQMYVLAFQIWLYLVLWEEGRFRSRKWVGQYVLNSQPLKGESRLTERK